MEKLKPDATGIYVAAHQAPGAIEEAIEAQVPLIVAVAEHIPIHDLLRVKVVHLRYREEALKILDTFRIEDAVEISSRRCKLSGCHFGDWEM